MAAGDILKGKDLRITFVDGTIYHATECAISSTRAFDEVATKDTNGNIVTPDTYSWNMTASGLVANKPGSSSQKDIKDLWASHIAGTIAAVEFKTTETGDMVLSGNVYVESIEMTASTEGRATYSATLRGDGDLTQSEVTP
jgi:hypothetical protein